MKDLFGVEDLSDTSDNDMSRISSILKRSSVSDERDGAVKSHKAASSLGQIVQEDLEAKRRRMMRALKAERSQQRGDDHPDKGSRQRDMRPAMERRRRDKKMKMRRPRPDDKEHVSNSPCRGKKPFTVLIEID